MNRNNVVDAAAVVFFCVGSVLVWLPSRYLPYFWDSSGFFVHTSKAIYDSGFSTFVAVDTNFAHGTVIQTGLALMWKLFTQSLLVSHVYMLGFLPLLLISTYVWLKTFLDRTMAFIGTFAIMTAPVVLAEYMNVYVDLPAAALTMTAVALISKRHYKAGYSVFAAAILSKMTMLSVLPYLLFVTPKTYRRFSLIPLTALVGYLVYHYTQRGWWLVEPGRPMTDVRNLTSVAHTIYIVVLNFILRQGRLVWLGVLLVYPFMTWYRSQKLQITPHDTALLGTVAATMGMFGLLGEYVNRYAIYLLPFYIALALRSLVKVNLNTSITLILAGATAIVPIFSWKAPVSPNIVYNFYTHDDLSILDSITVFRQLAVYLQYAAPNALVYGGFPENVQLTEPFQGYVVKPMQFSSCDNFELSKDQLQLVVMHPYAPSQIACRKLLDSYTLLPMQKFEQQGKWIELYQVNDQKASPKTDDPSPAQG